MEYIYFEGKIVPEDQAKISIKQTLSITEQLYLKV